MFCWERTHSREFTWSLYIKAVREIFRKKTSSSPLHRMQQHLVNKVSECVSRDRKIFNANRFAFMTLISDKSKRILSVKRVLISLILNCIHLFV